MLHFLCWMDATKTMVQKYCPRFSYQYLYKNSIVDKYCCKQLSMIAINKAIGFMRTKNVKTVIVVMRVQYHERTTYGIHWCWLDCECITTATSLYIALPQWANSIELQISSSGTCIPFKIAMNFWRLFSVCDDVLLVYSSMAWLRSTLVNIGACTQWCCY